MLATIFYAVLAVMLTAYVVLDGFDFGAGILHRALARTDDERRAVYAAIGPFWDGNEVWLLASGGLTFAIFPSVLGSALSGMYLAIFLFVWLLLGRGLAIELRAHLHDPMWRSFWDTVFVLASLGLALLLGIAGGNLVRGFMLDGNGDFQLALFDDFSPFSASGLVDAFTLAGGLYAMVALTLHGARFLGWKQSGAFGGRADVFARRLAPAVGIVWIGLLALTHAVRPSLLSALPAHPIAIVGVGLAVAGLVLAARAKALLGFIGSSLHLVGVLVATAASAYPALVYARSGESLTIYNSAAPASSLTAASTWYPFGLVLATLYAVALFRMHRGKIVVEPESAANDDHVTARPTDERIR